MLAAIGESLGSCARAHTYKLKLGLGNVVIQL